MGRRLEKRLKAVNPHASNPSTAERERAERQAQRRSRVTAVSRVLGGLRREPKPRWPF